MKISCRSSKEPSGNSLAEVNEAESGSGNSPQKTAITVVAARRGIFLPRSVSMLAGASVVFTLACLAIVVLNPVAAQAMDGIFADRFESGVDTCTVANWGMVSGLSDANAGMQDGSNRRYGGVCGLRVPVDGTARFVSDNSPLGEASYIARFYTFLDHAGSDPIQIFAADDGWDDSIQVWYNEPATGDLTLRVYDSESVANDVTFKSVNSGWHSIELVWFADAAAEIAFSVDGAADLIATINTSGQYIDRAYLGNINGANTGGGIDFDNFDSRRIERPGRLLVGDANDDGTITVADIIAIADDINVLGFAPGQPDCNEDGEIDSSDISCIVDILDSQQGELP